MAKKKKVIRKKAKKTAKKKAKKTAKKKAGKKPKSAKPKRDPLNQLEPKGLHAKKLEIMKKIPVMPCSAIGKDRNGYLYAYTQASKVFYEYQQECIELGLVINMIECRMSTATYPDDFKTKDGWVIRNIQCSRAECKFRITDTETGQSEEFTGAGLGDNECWGDTSAQTVAFKEALLLYFLAAWPQPKNTVKIIKEELKQLKGREMIKAIENVFPEPVVRILTSTGAIEEMKAFFSGE